MKTALIVLAEGFEEIEAVAIVDILRRADVACTVAAQRAAKSVTGRSCIQVVPDARLEEVVGRAFDLVALPGGPGTNRLRQDERVLAIVRDQAESGRLLGAICAAPTVLVEAGVLELRKATAHASVASQLPHLVEEAVVRDGSIVTSRGAGTAVEFALALVEELCGAEAAASIREAIHA
jgi:protein deglycase